MNEPTLQKYAASILSGFISVPFFGYLIGKITGEGFGDIFVLGLYIILIAPLFLALVVVGSPIFKVTFGMLKVTLIFRVFISGIVSLLLPIFVLPLLIYLMFGIGGSPQYFYRAYFSWVLISIPFVLIATTTYALMDKYA